MCSAGVSRRDRKLSFNSISILYFCSVILLIVQHNRSYGLSISQEFRTISVLSKNGTHTQHGNLQRECECMEYWNCTIKKGQIYSYCGISDSEVCCFFDDPKPVPIQASLPEPDSNKTIKTLPASNQAFSRCGVTPIQPNLDNVAAFKEWPWHVAILEAKDDIYICGGSLISSDRVLTAAHCVAAYTGSGIKKGSRLKIRAGEYDVSSNTEPLPHIEILVDDVTLHPTFDKSSLQNDIAVLRLVRSIPKLESRENVVPVCLPGLASSQEAEVETSIASRRCVVTGWGRPNESSEHSVILKEIVVPLWENAECERRLRAHFGPTYLLPTNSLCAGDKGKDACDGDGGGPLVCYKKGAWIQEGIVSFGIGCGRAAFPGIYTRVSAHVEFLKSII